ncbi:MAG TPA: HDIG domain-containing protein [Kiritimatiellia bacterium]|mgnify:FL=1|nr:HDIG domain-containing protein [Kiritimatiellia bacterium]HQF21460.1 HDIG domain-containing protein [Kiritimatiellia bacterium]HQG75486.1 HDIG domain-containing protein [Kiritimatiellia bacterium]HXK79516.1 HDIG domain-containing protein [Kiritimatiellia bacterium]
MAMGNAKKQAVRVAAAQDEPLRVRGWRMAGNVALLLALWLIGVMCIQVVGRRDYASLAPGQRAPATVVAAYDFDCVNLPVTELLRQQAADAVTPVFALPSGSLQAARRGMEKALAEEAGPLRHASEDEKLLAALRDSLTDIWLEGILAPAEQDSAPHGPMPHSQIDILHSLENGTPSVRTVQRDDLLTPEKARAAFAEAAQRRLGKAGGDISLHELEDLVKPILRPNLEYDEAATQARRLEAQNRVEPVMITVREGTTLMEEGSTVTPQTVEYISKHNRKLVEKESPTDRRLKRGGDAALMLIVLVICTGWLRSTQPGVYTRSRRKGLLILLALLALLQASLFRWLSTDLYWIPPWLAPFAITITLPSMLAALMMGPAAALAVGLWSGLATALIFERSFELLLLGVGGSVLAVALLRNVRKRSQVMRAGLAVGLLEGVVALALAALYLYMKKTFLIQVATGIGSGVLSALLALLILPFLEWMFQHTTDITLLELTDMGHPLLQRLAIEAPGTFHHSLMVGALAQAAAARIQANSLLVLVCAYFHDIGKLTKPEFFVENQRGGENPHDGLAPSMSALVIQSHVKEGLTLAKRYKLPLVVSDAITMHHGTSLTSYFYQVARRALKDAGMAEDGGLEHSFRYDGPRPTSREQAIVMLADTVEAASRSLEKPTPNRIEEMVTALFRDKLLDGQLDTSPLTLAELHQIQESFVSGLTNILHGRNPYPRENPSAQSATGAVPQPPAAAPAGAGTGSLGVSG